MTMETETKDHEKEILAEIYGEYCFSDSLMRERLPKGIYRELKRVQAGEKELTLDIAEVVAEAMKDWAISKGATHYTHWFQPLTGLTAEKHDSFISPRPDGTIQLEFSGKELIKGEPDASSFPNGGLRSTFEARGYTAWDTTSPAFLKKDKTGLTLCIPTAFVAYTGEALDKKTPLLRSMEAVNTQAIRVLRALGNDSSQRITTTLGPEQEYFLVDRKYTEERPDLLLAGRTVYGSMSAKGQELDDHYFGAIKERVADFMRELNHELWKLGVPAKTQHNEVAPNQFELATIFNSANVATDHNQLVMETIRKVAARHGLAALLHEKPFAGVNGSGKHNNWSMSSDDGLNLLEPGDNPHKNARFLLFLTAVIKAVDTYAPLLRASAANSGNDHRLGANEAPPAIISIFLGDQLTDILEALSSGKTATSDSGARLEIGSTTLPHLPKDLTDRNRTSPFAFTGNKFEFRMVPSSASTAGPNCVLNTAVSEVLDEFASRLEKAKDVNKTLETIVAETYREHKRIIFNGNGYGEEWLAEAAKRGLPNIPSTVEALTELTTDTAVRLFEKYSVFTREELASRQLIYLEEYSKQINIEANLMLEMGRRQILPAAARYAKSLADALVSVRTIDADTELSYHEELVKDLSRTMSQFRTKAQELEGKLDKAREEEEDLTAQAQIYREEVFALMGEMRILGDTLEGLMDREYWPFPSYEELLFRL